MASVCIRMLRHSCGYYLANKGVDFRTTQDFLGHRDPKHTTRYTVLPTNPDVFSPIVPRTGDRHATESLS